MSFPAEPIATSCWVWPNLVFLYRLYSPPRAPKRPPISHCDSNVASRKCSSFKNLLASFRKAINLIGFATVASKLITFLLPVRVLFAHAII